MATLTERLAFIEDFLGKGILSRDSKNFAVRCPICAPTDRSKKKLTIRTDDDANHCWRCGFRARSLLPLLKRFGTKEQMRRYLVDFLGKSFISAQIEIEKTTKEKLALPTYFEPLMLHLNSKMPHIRQALDYLIKKRNLTLQDIVYYKIGVSDFDQWKNRVIVPSFNSVGELNYFVGRAISDKTFKKYENPQADTTSIIFNELNVDWSSRVVLCEGVFDMFNCGNNVIPLLGSNINENSKLFDEILKHNAKIALALDSDMYTTKVPKIISLLESYDIDVTLVSLPDKKDPGKMSKLEFAQALEQSTHLTWEHKVLTRLKQTSFSSFKI